MRVGSNSCLGLTPTLLKATSKLDRIPVDESTRVPSKSKMMVGERRPVNAVDVRGPFFGWLPPKKL